MRKIIMTLALSTLFFSCIPETNKVAQPGWPVHLLALATLGIVGTALAMLLMNSLIRYSSAVTASSVTYVIPIFAIMWGVLDYKIITILNIVCMAFILAGVYLINLKSRKRPLLVVDLKL